MERKVNESKLRIVEGRQESQLSHLDNSFFANQENRNNNSTIITKCDQSSMVNDDATKNESYKSEIQVSIEKHSTVINTIPEED